MLDTIFPGFKNVLNVTFNKTTFSILINEHVIYSLPIRQLHISDKKTQASQGEFITNSPLFLFLHYKV